MLLLDLLPLLSDVGVADVRNLISDLGTVYGLLTALQRLLDRRRGRSERPAEVVPDTLGDRSEPEPTKSSRPRRKRRAKPKADVDA